jgi:glycosyltransferase involved in cell wall biosynthesis
MMAYFSIIIPTYNRGSLVAKAIASALGQTDPDFEIIVVDDGSTDDTADIVKSFTDARVKYVFKTNGERGAARNHGMGLATGSYINFFDSDDIMYPHHLSTARTIISQKNDPEFLHLGYNFMTEDGTITGTIAMDDNADADLMMFDNRLSCNGVFIRRDIAVKYPFEEDRMLASAEDWALWIKLLSRYTLHFSSAVTTAVVGHDQRSIHVIDIEKIVPRDLFLISCLEDDPEVRKRYGSRFSRFKAERFTFIMLGFSQVRNRKKVFEWAWKASVTYAPIVFSRRFISALISSVA